MQNQLSSIRKVDQSTFTESLSSVQHQFKRSEHPGSFNYAYVPPAIRFLVPSSLFWGLWKVARRHQAAKAEPYFMQVIQATCVV